VLFNRGLVILANRELMIMANTWVIELDIKVVIVLSNIELIILAKRGVTLQYSSERRRLRTEQMVAEATYISRQLMM
jgi:hypothetical protein